MHYFSFFLISFFFPNLKASSKALLIYSYHVGNIILASEKMDRDKGKTLKKLTSKVHISITFPPVELQFFQ